MSAASGLLLLVAHRCALFVVGWLSRVVCWLLCEVCCLLLVVCRLLFAVCRCLSCVVCGLSFVARCRCALSVVVCFLLSNDSCLCEFWCMEFCVAVWCMMFVV